MKKRYKLLILVTGLIVIGFLIPEEKVIPVEGATINDWHADTFWFEPWGKSGVHKGIDIFAKKGANVVASTNLLLFYKGNLARGGKVILGLGPKWRVHYFAHLSDIHQDAGMFVRHNQVLGQVGDTGNAYGKPPHLHYSIVSLIPIPWRMDTGTQGFKKMFYINPIYYLTNKSV